VPKGNRPIVVVVVVIVIVFVFVVSCIVPTMTTGREMVTNVEVFVDDIVSEAFK